ncbi:MAG: SPASM domain-containing protein, partial [Candidatus Nanoarchaeia archaeon]
VTQRKGSFKRFTKGAQLLAKKGIYTSANMVVDKSTVKSVYETGKLALDLGFKGFNATRISPSNNGLISDYNSLILNNKDIVLMLDQLMELKKNFGIQVGSLNALPYCAVDDISKYDNIFSRSCVAGLTTAGISSMGDVRACHHFDISYGNVFEKNLQAIWNNIPIWKEKYYNDNCTGCSYDYKCAGGCKENANKISNNMSGDDNLKAKHIKKKKKRNDEEYSNISSIQLKKGLKIRDEEVGSIILKDPSAYAYLDDFTTFYVKQAYSSKIINRDDLLSVGATIGVYNTYVNKFFATIINNRLGRNGG